MFQVACVSVAFVVSACNERASNPQANVERVDSVESKQTQQSLQHAPRPSPHLNSATAFELVASSGGALLVWAPGPCSEGIFVQRYAADGEPLAEPSKLDGCAPARAAADTKETAEIVQLSAVADGGKLGLVWVVRGASGSQVLGSFGADSANAFAPTLLLGAAAHGDMPGRSRLAIAGAENGQMRVTWRAPAAPCSSSPGSCARVLTSSHPPTQEAAARGNDAREIPDPCDPLLVGALWRSSVWYEAFCALSASHEQHELTPTTEVYAIRPEIFYAEAFPTLAGCTPLGIAPAPKGVLLLGMCGGSLRAHSVGESRGDVIADAVRELRCDNGRPSLEIHNGQGQSIAYKLDAPSDRLELWLSSSLAPPETRVAFTGRKLLIATAKDSRLKVQAWKCHGETLVSDDPTML